MASVVLPKLIGDIVAAGAFGTFCAIDGMFENNGNGVSHHRFTYNNTLVTRNSDNKITINKSGTLNLIVMSASATAFNVSTGRFTIKLNDVALSATEQDSTNIYCRYTTEVAAGDVLYIVGNDNQYTDEAGYVVTFLDCASSVIYMGAPWSTSGTIGQNVSLQLSSSLPYNGTITVDMYTVSSGQNMLMPRAGLTQDSVQLQDGESALGSNYKLSTHTTLSVTKGSELWIYCGRSSTGNSGTFARYSAFYSAYN